MLILVEISLVILEKKMNCKKFKMMMMIDIGLILIKFIWVFGMLMR